MTTPPSHLRLPPEPLLKWHTSIQGRPAGESAESDTASMPTPGSSSQDRPLEKKPHYRGEGAQLRRCSSLTPVVFTPGYHRLLLALHKEGIEPTHDPDSRHRRALALVATVLAHVAVHRDNRSADSTLPRRLGMPAEPHSKRPLMSHLRFRQLLECESPEDLFLPAIRLVALLGQELDIVELANALYSWSHETRKRWAEEYYGQTLSEDKGASTTNQKGEAA